eukprot:2711041-Ditylum_brightwellii.AAC.1
MSDLFYHFAIYYNGIIWEGSARSKGAFGKGATMKRLLLCVGTAVDDGRDDVGKGVVGDLRFKGFIVGD